MAKQWIEPRKRLFALIKVLIANIGLKKFMTQINFIPRHILFDNILSFCDVLDRAMVNSSYGILHRDDNLMKEATSRGYLPVMKWLLANSQNIKWLKYISKCRWESHTFAAVNGSLESMTSLKDYGCPWDGYTFTESVACGNMDNINWLKQNGCPFDSCTFAKAAQCGNILIMKWLKNNDCPWDERTFECAASFGSLDNMKWLNEKGCPFGNEIYVRAVENDNLKNIEWVSQLLGSHIGDIEIMTYEHNALPV